MVCSSQCYSKSCSISLFNIFRSLFLWRFSPIIQSPLIHFHRPLVLHLILDPRIYPVKQIFLVFYGRQQLKVLFRGLLHINAARKAAVVHLMRWWQLFYQIFLCSYPFPVHLKSIFTAGASWKVTQVKTKFTLLTFVRSEEDDPLGPKPFDIYLLYYLLRGLSPCFLLLGRVIINEWDFKPNAKAQVLAPTPSIIQFVCKILVILVVYSLLLSSSMCLKNHIQEYHLKSHIWCN